VNIIIFKAFSLRYFAHFPHNLDLFWSWLRLAEKKNTKKNTKTTNVKQE